MLTTRRLPPEEWDRLPALEPFRGAGLPPGAADDSIILVVERDGRIVGTCSLFNTVHWDCWWVDPESRRKGSVLRALLTHALSLLTAVGQTTVYTGAEHDAPEAGALLERFGFVPATGRLFVLDVTQVRQKLKEPLNESLKEV